MLTRQRCGAKVMKALSKYQCQVVRRWKAVSLAGDCVLPAYRSSKEAIIENMPKQVISFQD